MLDIIEDKAFESKVEYEARKETNYIVTAFHAEEATAQEIYREHRGKFSMFDMGVHFLIMTNGDIYRGIPLTAHADILYDHAEDGVYILCVGCDSKKNMTSVQARSYKHLLAFLDSKYSDVKHKTEQEGV